MEIIRIDGRNLPTREAVHDYFTTCLQLPGYYGRNLDALYDILTERAEPTRLVICGPLGGLGELCGRPPGHTGRRCRRQPGPGDRL